MTPLDRRSFLALTAAGLSAATGEPSPFVLFTPGEARRMRETLSKDSARQDRIRALAAKAMQAGPWSVTFKRPEGVEASVQPNDYYSEGPYWWPDPKNPKGPYIRKDGERNPARFMGNRGDLSSMTEAVLSLGMASYFLSDAAAAGRANRVLAVWFADPKTRMNPNLEYGQAVRGHNTGRGIGIIDTVAMIHCAIGAALANESGKIEPAVMRGVREWYASYLKWMTTSEKGLDEKKATNNHATWWTAQAAAYAAFTSNAAAMRMCWEQYRTHLVPVQIEPDGSCPREEERSDGLSYSVMNLDGFSVICRLALQDGEDLWRFQSAKGGSVEKAAHYVTPYVLDPKTWKKNQMNAFQPNATIYTGLAGIGLKSTELKSAYEKLPRAGSPWIQVVDLLLRSA